MAVTLVVDIFENRITVTTTLLPRRPERPSSRHRRTRRISLNRDAALLAALLAVTTVLYLWDLTASGYANTFYAAAAQAGSKDWTAWFFGSLDSENFITVDKPPASLWVMGLSARIFGFSSASLLVPQALMGVGAVATVYAAVKRVATPTAGLLAGAVLAATPAAALMFKFDNPDALLVLLMSIGGYFVVRSLETRIGRRAAMWLAFAGVALGFAFLTKMLQGLLVLPAFGITYLVAGQVRLRARLLHLLGAFAALTAGAGWWVLTVALWPASARPYIGGSTDNTVMDLVLGYNGLGRIFGSSGGSGGGGGVMSDAPAGSSFGGSTGLDRLFGNEMGIQISWLIPAALVALVFGLIARGRARRTDLLRASLILWGGWFVVTGLIFSYMSGTIHPYYTVALAPAIAGLIGTGGYALWSKRQSTVGRVGLASMMLAAGICSWVLLQRNAEWLPALKWILLVGTVIAAALILVGGRYRTLAAVAVIAGSLAGLGGSMSYAVATSATAHGGSVPTAGPEGAVIDTGFGGGGGQAPMEGEMPTGEMPTGEMPTGDATGGDMAAGDAAGGDMGGGMTAESSDEVNALLESADTKWSAAVNSSMTAATYELATDTAVIAIGGWSGDPAPTLDQFISYVSDHQVKYYISGGMRGPSTGDDSENVSTQIAEWVAANFTATAIDGITIYDMSGYTG